MRLIKHNRTKSLITGYASALIAAFLFGSVSSIAKPVLETANPFLLSSLVYLVSGLVFTPIIYSRYKATSFLSETHPTSFSRKNLSLVILTSLLGATVAPAMFFFGLEHTTAVDSSLLANGETFFSIIFAILFFKEKLKPLGYIASLMVLAGVTVITTNLQFHDSLLEMNLGNFFVLGATILWGFDNNICRIITTHMKIIKLVQLKSLIGGTVLFTFTIFILHVTPLTLTSKELPQIILLGSAGFGASLYFFLISMIRIGIVKSVLILSLSSVFGLVFASLLLHEKISIQQIIAIVIMIGGIYLISIESNEDSAKVTGNRAMKNRNLKDN